MGLEFQFRERTLIDLVTRLAQQRLYYTWIPPFGDHFIDRTDVVAAEARLVQADDGVLVHIPVEIHVATREHILASPNEPPPTRTSRDQLSLRITTEDVSRIVVRCVGAQLSHLGELVGLGLGAAERTIVDKIGKVGEYDLKDQLSALGLAPTSSRVVHTDRVVSIQMDTLGPTSNRLFADHDWGVFLDAATIRQLVLSRTGLDRIEGTIPFTNVDVSWRPVGETPRVQINVSGRIPTPLDVLPAPPLVGWPSVFEARAAFTADFSVRPDAERLLLTAAWQLHVDLGGPLAVANPILRTYIAIRINQFLADQPGVTVDGDRSLKWEQWLPLGGIGLAALGLSSVRASAAGLTLGGGIHLPTGVGQARMQATVKSFASLLVEFHCGPIGMPGSSSDDVRDRTKINASVGFHDTGTFGGWTLLSGSPAAPFIREDPEFHTLSVTLPLPVAGQITSPVTILVQTSRGTRLVDLGVPADAIEDDPEIVYHPSCLSEALLNRIALHWNSIFDENGNPIQINPLKGHPKDLPPPIGDWPPRGLIPEPEPRPWRPRTGRPDWQGYVERKAGFVMELRRMSGLDAGEQVFVRYNYHAIDLTADARGELLLPIMISGSDRFEVLLDRASRREIVSSPVRSVKLEWFATIAAGTDNWLGIEDAGSVVAVAEFADRTEVYALALDGPRLRAADGTVTRASRPGPTGLSLDLPGLDDVIDLPGLADQPLAIALIDDFTARLIDLGRDGVPRVAGVLAGPIGPVDIADGWAMITGPEHNTLFRVY